MLEKYKVCLIFVNVSEHRFDNWKKSKVKFKLPCFSENPCNMKIKAVLYSSKMNFNRL